MSASSPTVVVVAAVIEREDGRLLVTRRLAGTHLAGLWEFPGGKCEPGESHDACLVREIAEELGVTAIVGHELFTTEHDYTDRVIRLHFHWCRISAEPRALLGQQLRWVTRAELASLKFPPADRELIERLSAKREVGSQKPEV